MVNQAVKGLQGEDLSSGGDEHLFHVFGANAKPPASNAGDDLVLLLDVRRFEAVAGILEAQKVFRFNSLAPMLSATSAHQLARTAI